MIKESKARDDLLYFHGSKEAKYSKIKAPSTRHPFYITSDLHYAMAFCSKSESSTGEWEVEKTYSKDRNDNFCYIITLNKNANFFDFRQQKSSEFKKLFNIIPKNLFEYIQENITTTDIYDFTVFLDIEVLSPIQDAINAPNRYDNYSNVYDLYYEAFKEKCDIGASQFSKPMDEQTFQSTVKMMDNFNLWDTIDSIHERMQFILDALKSFGFQGIITSESDYNDEKIEVKVTTNYAIGIWDKNALDLLSPLPMKYKWLKKINPRYIDNSTDSSAIDKIKKYQSIYKQLTKNA